jgi:DNA polymerase I
MVNTTAAARTETRRPIVLSGPSSLVELGRMASVYLRRGLPFGFDTETTGLEPHKHRLVAMQFFQPDSGAAPVILDCRKLDLRHIYHILQPLFNGLVAVGINLKFDYKMLKYHTGVEMVRMYDLMLAEQCIRGMGVAEAQAEGIGFNLLALGERYKVSVSKEERSWFIDLDKRPEWHLPFPQEQIEYMGQDVTALFPIQRQQLTQISALELAQVCNLEFKAIAPVAEIELAGVPVDVEKWRDIMVEVEQELVKTEEEAIAVFGPAILEARAIKFDEQKARYDEWIYARDDFLVDLRYGHGLRTERGETTEPWGTYKTRMMKEWREEHPNPGKPKEDTSLPNIHSHAQLLMAFERMGIPLDTTRDSALAELEPEFPQLSVLRRASKLNKFLNSFGESLLKYVEEDGRIHPDYQQYGASTGRMSCRRPNWQQIPSRDEIGKRLRGCVVAGPEKLLLTADYSSIEPRILGELSGDEELLRQFAEGMDIYSEMAIKVKKLPSGTNVKKEYPKLRSIFKVIVLGVSYGMGARSMAKQADISLEEAQANIEGFFNLYPGVKKWAENQKAEARVINNARTLSGRWRPYEIPTPPKYPKDKPTDEALSEWREKKQQYTADLARIERQRLNTPIQGTSADIIKQALIYIHESIKGMEGVEVVAVVHDEIVIECPVHLAARVSKAQADCMERAVKKYLKRAYVPRPDVIISDHWSKE